MNAVLQDAEVGRSGAAACILKIDALLRDENLVVRLQNRVFFAVALFDDSLQVDDHSRAVLARQLDFPFVAEIAESTRADDRLADRISFISRNFLRSLRFHLTGDVNLAAGFFADVIDRDDDRGVVIIFTLERGLNRVSQFLATLARRLDEPDVRNFQLAAVVDAQTLGFVVAILDNAEADVIVRPEFLPVVEHRHGIGSHDRAGGRRFDHSCFGNRRRHSWAGLLRRERHRPRDGGSGEECEGPGSHAMAIVSLETVGAIKRDAILAVIAQQLI